jgi:hypothetical protein
MKIIYETIFSAFHRFSVLEPGPSRDRERNAGPPEVPRTCDPGVVYLRSPFKCALTHKRFIVMFFMYLYYL